MLILFLIAGLLTVILGLVFFGSVIAGFAFFLMRRFRPIAPFVFFVPSLAALGGASGSWGLSYVVAENLDLMSVLPLWIWILGLPLGGALGFLIGLALALLTKRFFNSNEVSPVQEA